MVRGPQGIEQEEIEAPKYSRSTENYCFKDGVWHKRRNATVMNATKANLIKTLSLELVQLNIFINS